MNLWRILTLLAVIVGSFICGIAFERDTQRKIHSVRANLVSELHALQRSHPLPRVEVLRP